MTYRLHGITEDELDGVPAWDRGIGEADVPVAPVRAIPITPEVLAEEAAKQADRAAEIPSSWAAFKATLSEDNLHRGRLQISPGRHMRVVVAEKDAKPAPKPRRPAPRCACGAKVKGRTKQCMACYKAAREAAAAVRTQPVATSRPQDVPQPSTRRRTMAKFVINKPISEAEAPAQFSLPGRVSQYVSLFDNIRALKPKDFLPVTVEETKSGLNMVAALRKMAEREGKAIELRTSSDRLTFYLRLTDKAPETK